MKGYQMLEEALREQVDLLFKGIFEAKVSKVVAKALLQWD